METIRHPPQLTQTVSARTRTPTRPAEQDQVSTPPQEHPPMWGQVPAQEIQGLKNPTGQTKELSQTKVRTRTLPTVSLVCVVAHFQPALCAGGTVEPRFIEWFRGQRTNHNCVPLVKSVFIQNDNFCHMVSDSAALIGGFVAVGVVLVIVAIVLAVVLCRLRSLR